MYAGYSCGLFVSDTVRLACSAGLEAQLETEHEERRGPVREKHELERRIIMLNETTISQHDQEAILKLKRDLKRTRALLKDAQAQLEKARSEASSKVQIRQLKTRCVPAGTGRLRPMAATGAQHTS